MPDWKKHSLPALLALAALAIQLAPPLQTLLRYDRQAIGAGEFWRLLSGNLPHLNWPHLWLNLAGLLLIWLLVHAFFTLRQWLLALCFTAAGVGIGLYLFNPELLWYVGLSGMLHGLLVAPLVWHFRRNCVADHLLLALVLGKTFWEQLSGPMSASESLIEGQVVTDAHLYGSLSGLVLGLLMGLWQRIRQTGPAQSERGG